MCTNLYFGNSILTKYHDHLFKTLGTYANNHIFYFFLNT